MGILQTKNLTFLCAKAATAFSVS